MPRSQSSAVEVMLWVDGEDAECHDWGFKQSHYITSKNSVHFFPSSPRILFLAWPNVIISQFTFFSTHFFQAIDPCGLVQPCWIFLPMNKLPFTAFLTIPCAISQAFLPFGSWSCLCYCFHYFKNGEDVFLLKLPNLVFTLLDSKVCCLGAGRWMKQKSHWFDFPFQFSDLSLLAWFRFFF